MSIALYATQKERDKMNMTRSEMIDRINELDRQLGPASYKEGFQQADDKAIHKMKEEYSETERQILSIENLQMHGIHIPSNWNELTKAEKVRYWNQSLFNNGSEPKLIFKAMPKHDPVNHPKHYTSHPSGVECIQITRHMTFNIGNAVKYLWRADLKNNTIEDLEKAIYYINDEIKRIKNQPEATYVEGTK